MTAQEIFNKCKDHLLKQGFKCQLTNPGSGIYKRHDGAQCPIGILIPDNEYNKNQNPMRLDQNIEFKSVLQLWKENNSLSQQTKDLFFINMALLTDIQNCHDKVAVENWKDELEKIAKKYELEYN